MTYTHTRITREHLDKLEALAHLNKRSRTKQLEFMIDQELAKEPRPDAYLYKPGSPLDGTPLYRDDQ